MNRIIIISGPSGSGKSTLCRELFNLIPNIYFSLSSTTRAPRMTEVNGVNYDFISRGEFEEGIKQGAFLEWEEVHHNLYGTKKFLINQALEQRKIVLFDIDVAGQKSIKKHYKEAISIFITTKTKDTLRERLISRGADDEESINNRLEWALKEMRSINDFDFVLINEDLNQSRENFLLIVKSLLLRRSKEENNLLLELWK